MKEVSLRNVLILLAAVIIALLVLGFVSTLLNQLIPITIALIVGVVLGRMSVRVNLISMIKDALRRPAKAAAKTEAPQSEAARTQPDNAVSAEVEAIKQRIAEVEEPAAPTEPEKAEITDFHIKTEDEILADAKRLEDEVAKRNATYDPAAALEERRRRLLGDKADQS